VRDANRQQLAYVYYENEPGRGSAAKLLSKDEARRIAAMASKTGMPCSRQWEPFYDLNQKHLSCGPLSLHVWVSVGEA
jgi:hypothetical protein